MMVAARLDRITGRLRTVVTTGSAAMGNRMAGISGDLRKVADQFLVLDGRAAAAVGHADPDARILFGVNPVTGMPHRFDPDRVRSVPILGRDRKVVGVYFPLKLRDTKEPLIFTDYALDTMRGFYWKSVSSGGPPRRRTWGPGGMVPAPWADGKAKDLIFARTHANANSYYVQVAQKIPFTNRSMWVPVRIDGADYGRLLAADRHFKEAVRGAPTADVIQMSCDVAAGPAGRESAESLHSYGIGLDLHATEKRHFYHVTDADQGPGLIRQTGFVGRRPRHRSRTRPRGRSGGVAVASLCATASGTVGGLITGTPVRRRRTHRCHGNGGRQYDPSPVPARRRTH